MTKKEKILAAGIKLALAEFKRISYQIKADPNVIESLETALRIANNELVPGSDEAKAVVAKWPKKVAK